jgi:hypothetical protein
MLYCVGMLSDGSGYYLVVTKNVICSESFDAREITDLLMPQAKIKDSHTSVTYWSVSQSWNE